jgi:very-short-patch-repair endonuclease
MSALELMSGSVAPSLATAFAERAPTLTLPRKRRVIAYETQGAATSALHSLSRLRGRVGVGVLQHRDSLCGESPHLPRPSSASASPASGRGEPSQPISLVNTICDYPARKRERESTAFAAVSFHHMDTNHPSEQRLGLPLPLAEEGWGGGIAASGVSMVDPEHPNWKVAPRLRSNARALRSNSTDAERLLWAALRGNRLNGAGFRRQVPIENYVADFVCHAAKLVIELDGGQHFSGQAERKDAARSAVIEARGFKVLRFGNNDVMSNRTGVLETIAAAVAERAPTLALPRKRERGQEKQTP